MTADTQKYIHCFLKYFVLFSVVLLSYLFSHYAHAAVAPISELEGRAWSNNVGWVSLNCLTSVTGSDICGTSDYRVELMDDYTLQGFAWNSSQGWIQFGGLTGCPAGNCDARLDTGAGVLHGWAQVVSSGEWLSLNCQNDGNCSPSYGVTVANDGAIADMAWGAGATGWLDFAGTNLSIVPGAFSKADLIAENLSASGSLVDGGSVTFEADIANVGALPSGGPWEVASARYDSINFFVGSQDQHPYGFFFKPDGTKMYMMGWSNKRVFQYSLTIPWDISTLVYDGVNKYVYAQDSNMSGIFFKPDGGKMYTIGYGNDNVYQYTLSTPWDITTATYDSVSVYIGAQDDLSNEVAFSSDGSYMYMSGAYGGTHQYLLSTPWDITTATYDAVGFYSSGPYGIHFKPDGSSVYVVTRFNRLINQYLLSTPWDITTATYESGSVNVGSEEWGPDGIYLKPDGSEVYIIGTQSDSIHKYSIDGLSTTRFCIDGTESDCLSGVTELGTVTTGLLGNGTSEAASSPSWTAEGGSHTLWVCADVNNNSIEALETNNCSSYDFDVLSECYDGIDNDGDGLIDAADTDACWFDPTLLVPAPTTKTIYAKSLTGYSCDPTEWHFVITQIQDPDHDMHIPESITAYFTDGAVSEAKVIQLEKFTGKTAHYRLKTSTYLSKTIQSAQTEIYTDWGGQFNVSHGPCNPTPPLSNLTVGALSYTAGVSTYADTDTIGFNFTSENLSVNGALADAYGAFSNVIQIDYGPSPDGVSDADVVTMVNSVTDLALDQTKPVSGTFDPAIFGSTLPAGLHKVRACADLPPENPGVIAEENENDNCGGWIDLTISSTVPDLVVENLTDSLGGSITDGQSVTFSADVRNAGAAYSVGWDITTTSFDSLSFYIGSEDTYQGGLYFRSDGTKMYTVGSLTDAAYQYTLSTPWDISSASYDNISHYLGLEESNVTGSFFKPDGTKMYVAGAYNDEIYQYTLSTPWDISSASYDNLAAYIGNEEKSVGEVFFKPDGTKMYIVGSVTSDSIHQYSLSVPWDASTATYDSVSLYVGAIEATPRGLYFDSSGTEMFILGYSSDRVHQFKLSTPWDISSNLYFGSSAQLSGTEPNPRKVFFKPDGTKMYMMGETNDRVYQYSLIPQTQTARFCVDGSEADCLGGVTTQLSISNVPTLDATGGANDTENITSSSWTATVGNHTLWVCADVDGVVSEGTEGNNCASYPFTVQLPPDLVSENLGVNGTLIEDEVLTFSANVRNQGGAYAGALSLVGEVGVVYDDVQGGTASRIQYSRESAVSGNYAYVVATQDDALSIFDISDPTNPIEIGVIVDNNQGGAATGLDNPADIVVRGNYAYVTSALDDALSIFDISDPTNPIQVGIIVDDSKGGTGSALGANHVFVSGNYAYVTGGGGTNAAFSIIDISDPTNPTEVGVIFDDSVGGAATGLSNSWGVAVSGNYAYVAGNMDNALSVFDISDPANPTQVGIVLDDSMGGTATGLDGPYHVAVSGNYAYVTGSDDDALSIIDVTNPTNPVEVGAIFDNNKGGAATRLDSTRGVAISGNYAFVTSEFDHALTLIDVSDPTNPTEVDVIVDNYVGGTATRLRSAHGVFVSGNYVYVNSTVDDGFTVIEIASNPTTANICLNSTNETDCFNGNGTFVDTASVPVLASGGIESITTGSSWTAVLGNHTLYVCADVNDDVAESEENNNCASYPFTIEAATPAFVSCTAPGLLVDPQVVRSGEEAVLHWTNTTDQATCTLTGGGISINSTPADDPCNSTDGNEISVYPESTTRYTLTCDSDESGNTTTWTDTGTVYVVPYPSEI